MQPGVFQDPGCVMCAALLKINPAMVNWSCIAYTLLYTFVLHLRGLWSISGPFLCVKWKQKSRRINAAAFTYFHFHMIYITVKLWYIFGPQETKILHQNYNIIWAGVGIPGPFRVRVLQTRLVFRTYRRGGGVLKT